MKYYSYYCFYFVMLFGKILLAQSIEDTGLPDTNIMQFKKLMIKSINKSKKELLKAKTNNQQEHKDSFKNSSSSNNNNHKDISIAQQLKMLSSYSINTTGTVITKIRTLECNQLQEIARQVDQALSNAQNSCDKVIPTLSSILSSGDLLKLEKLARLKCVQLKAAAMIQRVLAGTQWPGSQSLPSQGKHLYYKQLSIPFPSNYFYTLPIF